MRRLLNIIDTKYDTTYNINRYSNVKMNDYMKMSYRMEIVEDKEESGYVVPYPDLPGCIACGK